MHFFYPCQLPQYGECTIIKARIIEFMYLKSMKMKVGTQNIYRLLIFYYQFFCFESFGLDVLLRLSKKIGHTSLKELVKTEPTLWMPNQFTVTLNFREPNSQLNSFFDYMNAWLSGIHIKFKLEYNFIEFLIKINEIAFAYNLLLSLSI